MKKSCERIAAVLGLPRDGSNDPGKRASIPASVHKVGVDTQFNPVNTEYGQTEPAGGGRANNVDGQPSGYKSLREKSPVRKSQSPAKGGVGQATAAETGAGGSDTNATKFASVSDNLSNFFSRF